MPDHLAAAKIRRSELAETHLMDYLGMMAPVVVEEVLVKVAAAKTQNEQDMLVAFCINLRRALPPEPDSEQVINSLYARYLQD